MFVIILAALAQINVTLDWDAPKASKPVVWLYTEDGCPPCRAAEAYDWSSYPFIVRAIKKDGFRAYPVFHMGATKPGQKPAYVYGFDPQKVLDEWNKRN